MHGTSPASGQSRQEMPPVLPVCAPMIQLGPFSGFGVICICDMCIHTYTVTDYDYKLKHKMQNCDLLYISVTCIHMLCVCVCLFVCVCMYTYFCIYVCMYIYISVYRYIFHHM